MRIDAVYKMEVKEIEFSLQRSTVKHNKFILRFVLINILISILLFYSLSVNNFKKCLISNTNIQTMRFVLLRPWTFQVQALTSFVVFIAAGDVVNVMMIMIGSFIPGFKRLCDGFKIGY